MVPLRAPVVDGSQWDREIRSTVRSARRSGVGMTFNTIDLSAGLMRSRTTRHIIDVLQIYRGECFMQAIENVLGADEVAQVMTVQI
jgi:hypothetical protein